MSIAFFLRIIGNTAIIHTNMQMDFQDKTGENRHE